MMGFPTTLFAWRSQIYVYPRNKDCQCCLCRANARARQSQDTATCPLWPAAGEGARRTHSRSPRRYRSVSCIATRCIQSGVVMTPDRMEQGLRHWNRASDLAVILDMDAGANETMAGAIFADLII